MSYPKTITKWYDAVQSLQHIGDAYALITVLGCTGSTPRDHSSKMVITTEETFDTIGGGHLEYLVMQKARDIMEKNRATSNIEQEIHHFPLAASLGQCCGGSATVLIETFSACDFHVAIFGAGHVAKSIVTLLAELNCKVSWLDSRPDEFPLEIPANVNKIISTLLCDELDELPNNSDVLILTHSHSLDFELCLSALKRNANSQNRLRSIGLIGSKTKSMRFHKRLSDRLLGSIKSEQIDMIRCPVGLSSVPGKLPMEVAISIVGELIAIDHASHQKTKNLSIGIDPAANKKRGLAWKEIKQQLNGELDSTGHGSVLYLGPSHELQQEIKKT